MKFETKFDIGQRVWVNRLGQIQDFYIQGIQVHSTAIKYYYWDNMAGIWYAENLLYATKEDAIKDAKNWNKGN